ncbi:MAG TPA: hypothetical protein VGA63_11965 [Geopsychrobacteraceae bacterium]
MFVQQKKLTFLNLPATRVRRLYVSTVDVPVALQDFPAQRASACLAALASGNGIQVLLGLYLADSCRSIFFLPAAGEVAPHQAEPLLQEGLEFAESIGFVMADADIHLLRPEQLDAYWRNLPICRKPADSEAAKQRASLAAEKPGSAPVTAAVAPPTLSPDETRQRCKESLGRFLASL